MVVEAEGLETLPLDRDAQGRFGDCFTHTPLSDWTRQAVNLARPRLSQDASRQDHSAQISARRAASLMRNWVVAGPRNARSTRPEAETDTLESDPHPKAETHAARLSPTLAITTWRP